jgi:hypothetical protein
MKRAVLVGLAFIVVCLVGVVGVIGLAIYGNEEDSRVARFVDYDACLRHESLVATRSDGCVAYLMGYANQKIIDPSSVNEHNVQAELDLYQQWVNDGRPQ